MKKLERCLIAFLLVSITAVASLWSASGTKRAVTAIFTAPETCFVGFSRRKVVNNVKLRDDELFQSSNVVDGVVNPSAVQFRFYPTDPIVSATPAQKGVYYSEPFYAYCQVSSVNKLRITLSVPTAMTAVPGGGSLAYECIDLPSMTEGLLEGTFHSWADASIQGGRRTLEFKDNAAGASREHRVLMSQPIFLRVDGSNLQQQMTETDYYVLNFQIKVETI